MTDHQRQSAASRGNHTAKPAAAVHANGEPLVCELPSTLLRLAAAWRTRLAEGLAESGINESRFALLRSIRDMGDEGASQTELAGDLRLSESNISTLLDRMVTDGLVERRRSQRDRRKSLVRLTDCGARLLALGEESHHCAASDLFAGWSQPECQKLLRQLSRLQQTLDTINGQLDNRQTYSLESKVTGQNRISNIPAPHIFSPARNLSD